MQELGFSPLDSQAILKEQAGVNLPNAHNPLSFSNVPGKHYGCAGIPNRGQTGGYRFNRRNSKLKVSKRRGEIKANFCLRIEIRLRPRNCIYESVIHGSEIKE